MTETQTQTQHPITKLRERLNFNRRELAEATRLGVRTLQYIEKGYPCRDTTRNRLIYFFQNQGLLPARLTEAQARTYFPLSGQAPRQKLPGRALPLAGLLWLFQQFLRDDYAAARQHLTEEHNYRIPNGFLEAARNATRQIFPPEDLTQ